MSTPLCFAIEPYQLLSFRDSTDALEARHTNFWAAFPYPCRLLTRTREVSFAPVRTALHAQSAALAALRALLDPLDRAVAGERQAAQEVLTLLARRHAAIDSLLVDDGEARTAGLRLDATVAAAAPGVIDDADTRIAFGMLRRAVARALWRWRWYTNYARASEVLEQLEPPMAIDHYLLVWADPYTHAPTLADTLKHTFFLAGIELTTLPPLYAGRYRAEATYLAPLDGGRPFLAVLTAWDVRGRWDLHSWRPLLMREHPLVLSMDVRTLPRGKALRQVTNAWNVLRSAAHGVGGVKDARSERAFGAAETAMAQLDMQSLHDVAIALLVEAPTLDELEQQIQGLRDSLGVRLRLDRLAGAQAEELKLFGPQPISALDVPLVWRNTLSQGVAAKTPWGIRKSKNMVGVDWGYDLIEKQPIYLQPFGLSGVENFHLMMVGRSGSGKTVTLLTLLLRCAVAGIQVVLLDPVGKCVLLTDAVGPGARYARVSTQAAINILDPLADDIGEQVALVIGKLAQLLGRTFREGDRIRFVLRDLDNFEIGVLDEALQQPALYGPAGERLATLTPATAPLLGDLVRALHTVADTRRLPLAATLAQEIELRAFGSRAPIYNRPTTLEWDFARDVTAYDFSGCEDLLLPLLLAHGFEALNRYVRSRGRRHQPPAADCVHRRVLHYVNYQGHRKLCRQRHENLAQLPGRDVDGGSERHHVFQARHRGRLHDQQYAAQVLFPPGGRGSRRARHGVSGLSGRGGHSNDQDGRRGRMCGAARRCRPPADHPSDGSGSRLRPGPLRMRRNPMARLPKRAPGTPSGSPRRSANVAAPAQQVHGRHGGALVALAALLPGSHAACPAGAAARRGGRRRRCRSIGRSHGCPGRERSGQHAVGAQEEACHVV